MKVLENCPCNDCITLAICKAYARSHRFIDCMSYLATKCSLLDRFLLTGSSKLTKIMKEGNHIFWRQKTPDEVYKFLGGE